MGSTGSMGSLGGGGAVEKRRGPAGTVEMRQRRHMGGGRVKGFGDAAVAN